MKSQKKVNLILGVLTPVDNSPSFQSPLWLGIGVKTSNIKMMIFFDTCFKTAFLSGLLTDYISEIIMPISGQMSGWTAFVCAYSRVLVRCLSWRFFCMTWWWDISSFSFFRNNSRKIGNLPWPIAQYFGLLGCVWLSWVLHSWIWDVKPHPTCAKSPGSSLPNFFALSLALLRVDLCQKGKWIQG